MPTGQFHRENFPVHIPSSQVCQVDNRNYPHVCLALLLGFVLSSEMSVFQTVTSVLMAYSHGDVLSWTWRQDTVSSRGGSENVLWIRAPSGFWGNRMNWSWLSISKTSKEWLNQPQGCVTLCASITLRPAKWLLYWRLSTEPQAC